MLYHSYDTMPKAETGFVGLSNQGAWVIVVDVAEFEFLG
jgi:hypothetical protein